MAVTYTKKQRAKAKEFNLPLITVSVPGLEFQGPVELEDSADLLAWIIEFFDRRYGSKKSQGGVPR